MMHTYTLRKKNAAGFSIVVAIFLLVVIGLLAAAIVSMQTVQQQESALDVQGARAYQAARAGIEWGLYQQLRVSPSICSGTTSFKMPAGTSLSSFSVSVTCVQTPSGPVSATARRQLTAVACNQPSAGNVCPNSGPITSPDYVQRKLQVQL